MFRVRIEEFARRIHAVPVVVWVLLGFFISYLLFFADPVFLHANSMQFFEPVQAADHLGIDLKIRLDWSRYALDHRNPLPDTEGTAFPPFSDLLFVPLLGVNFRLAYRLLTILTVLHYVVLTLVLPLLIRAERRLPAIAVLIAATGLISHGFLFELERGQWNVIVVALTFTAIWIFHWHPAQRLLAYVLFTIAAQLKIYPMIFIVLLVSDWRLWRENIIRLSSLAAANILLLFVQGPQAFATWAYGLRDWSATTWIWEGNPSIESAVMLAAGYATRHGWVGMASLAGPVRIFLSLLVILCLAAILFKAYRNLAKIPSAYYLLAAANGCLLLPGGGYDYRLSILGAPLVMVLLNEDDQVMDVSPFRNVTRRVAVLLLSLTYATTLLPSAQKPYYLANNFPALFAMLLLVTYLALVSREHMPVRAVPPM
jgi:hypothetical protein